MIDTGDVVFHKPTGEKWLVAYVNNNRLYWCGWPPGCADLQDCELVKKATPKYKEKIVSEILSMTTSVHNKGNHE